MRYPGHPRRPYELVPTRRLFHDDGRHAMVGLAEFVEWAVASLSTRSSRLAFNIDKPDQ